MNPRTRVRILAVALIVLFSLGTFAAVAAIFTGRADIHITLDVIINLGFVTGGVGLLKLKRRTWWHWCRRLA